ncbi:hypothetical protein NQ317_007607 [Molorchus minor]|uniref:BED-type domain-containing protein n=1 Tax=Molorchus minor TaxID=1323400 RepID=A0ABQ9JPJ3_9CUCU|nr:hypothetical protein NQ317_007607 [Molorchus minor]
MAFRKKSEIWKHFDFHEEDNKAKCNYCSALINISKGSTGNLTRHMPTKHVGLPIYRDKNVTESVPFDKNNNESNSEDPMKNEPGTSNANVPSAPKNPKRQEYMDHFVMSIKPVSINKSKQFDEQLLHSWTSINNENFTAITAHWLDDNEKDGLTSCSGLLDCIVYREGHTAENLAELLQTKIKEWGIQNCYCITLNPTDWEVANHAITILQVFNDVTSELSAEKNIAVSKNISFA